MQRRNPLRGAEPATTDERHRLPGSALLFRLSRYEQVRLTAELRRSSLDRLRQASHLLREEAQR